MSYLGKYWASAPTAMTNSLNYRLECGACHCIDIAGVASSILATPTIFKRPDFVQPQSGRFAFSLQ